MLTEKDIELMQEWRDEIVSNRMREVVLTTVSVTEHPLTGEEVDEESAHTVMSVVTERSSRTAPEVVHRDGAEVTEGDLWFSVSMDELVRINLTGSDGYDSVKYADHGGRHYRVVSWDRKGIGRRNRLEFLGKVVT